MRILLRVAYALMALIVILVMVGFFLPNSAHVERSITIDAAPDAIFPHVSEFEKMNAWSPWALKDPDTQYTYSGPASGVGRKMEWTSEHPDVGNGSQRILEIRDNEYVKTYLDFGDMGNAEAEFVLAADGGSTQVTWAFDSFFGTNLVFRYFGLMMDSWVGGDYEQGLANLKALVENLPAAPPEAAPEADAPAADESESEAEPESADGG